MPKVLGAPLRYLSATLAALDTPGAATHATPAVTPTICMLMSLMRGSTESTVVIVLFYTKYPHVGVTSQLRYS
jgi:hypothetical protein